MNLVLWCGVSSFCHSAACRVIRVAPAVVTGPPGRISVSCLLHWPARPCQCPLPPALACQALSVSHASCTSPPGLSVSHASCTGPLGHVSVSCLLHWPARPVSVSSLLHWPTRPCQCLMPPGQRREFTTLTQVTVWWLTSVKKQND